MECSSAVASYLVGVVRAAEGVRGGEEADDPRAVGEVGLLLLLVPPVAGERAAGRLAVEELVRGGHVHLGPGSAGGGLGALLLALLLRGRRSLGGGLLQEDELLLAVAVGAAAGAGDEAAEAPEVARIPCGGGLGERRWARVPRGGARRGPRRPRAVGVRRGHRRGGGGRLRRGRRLVVAVD